MQLCKLGKNATCAAYGHVVRIDLNVSIKPDPASGNFFFTNKSVDYNKFPVNGGNSVIGKSLFITDGSGGTVACGTMEMSHPVDREKLEEILKKTQIADVEKEFWELMAEDYVDPTAENKTGTMF